MSNEITPITIYQSLTPEQAGIAMRAEERIKTREVLTVIENGRDLIEVKKSLEHGQFTTWVEQAFRGRITIRTARRWMEAADYYGSKSDILSVLNDSVMMLLAAPSTPDEIREEVEARALAGEKITVAEVEELKREVKRAKEEAERFRAECQHWHQMARDAADREREAREHLRLARLPPNAPAWKPFPAGCAR